MWALFVMIKQITAKSYAIRDSLVSFSRAVRGLILIFMIMILFDGCGTRQDRITNDRVDERSGSHGNNFEKEMRSIEPFFQRMGRPANYDWLASHTEPGQTFAEFLAAGPRKLDARHNTIYALPLGDFRPQERQIIQEVTEYLSAFYGLPVKHMKSRPLTNAGFKPRSNRFTKEPQWKTGDIVEHILKPSFPDDAAALVAFTTADLYSNDSTNFVFGEANIEDRVGVWSLSRLDDNANNATYLRRTLKIAAHETGHMFSMLHCTKYECLMSGTNHLAETDRRPLDACPECSAKISWLSDVSFAERYQKLMEFCQKHGLDTEAKEFDAKLKTLGE